MDFQKLLERDKKARAVKSKLAIEDNMSAIADIIAALDEDMAKQVLKLFVYEQ